MYNEQRHGPQWVRELREKAEFALIGQKDANLPVHEMKALLHELSVYQIELEMQNEALRQTELSLEQARDRYIDLFEFCPVGYMTLTPAGIISEANFTGINLLNVERKQVVGRRFSHFVMLGYRDYWYLYLLDLVKNTKNMDCELRLLRNDGSSFYARLTGASLKSRDGQVTVRITLTDISEQKRMAEEIVDCTAELIKARDGTQLTSHADTGHLGGKNDLI